MKFRGTIHTDGVGISIIRQNKDTTQGPNPRRATTINPENIPYIHDLSPEQHEIICGRCVLIDPGRRGLLYCMHEESTVKAPRCYRYTSNQKNIRLKRTKFRHILQDLKAQAPNVIAAEREISQTSGRANNTTNFAFHTSVKAANSSILSSFYTSTVSRTSKKPLFRKLRFSSYINQRKASERLAKDIRAKFGQDCVLVMVNWSAHHNRYHEHIKGVEMRNLLRKHGFNVCLIDEYATSRYCPRCYQPSLQTFKQVENPRPYRRSQMLTMTRHGLLR
ncbi:hypothetical protein F4703DRAFT_1868955 [Phycomyces blakesleeanus]